MNAEGNETKAQRKIRTKTTTKAQNEKVIKTQYLYPKAQTRTTNI